MIKKLKQFINKQGQKRDNTVLFAMAILMFLAGALWITIGIFGFFSK